MSQITQCDRCGCIMGRGNEYVHVEISRRWNGPGFSALNHAPVDLCPACATVAQFLPSGELKSREGAR